MGKKFLQSVGLMFGFLLCGASAFGQVTVNLGPINSNANSNTVAPGGATAQLAVSFVGDGTSQGYAVNWDYDPAIFGDPTPVNGTGTHPGSLLALCQVDTGTHTFSVIVAGAAALANATDVCVFNIPVLAATPVGNHTLPVSATFPPDFGNGAGAGGGTASNGTVVVQAGPVTQPALTFNPPEANPASQVNIPSGGGNAGQQSGTANILINAAGAANGGTASSNCTFPAGFNVTNAVNNAIGNGNPAVTMVASCTLGNAASTGTLACQVDDSGANRTVNFTLNCPAGNPVPLPEFSSNPPAGAVTCNGAPGTTGTATINVTNQGSGAAPGSNLTVTCTTANAGFSVAPAGMQTIAVNGTTPFTVSCPVPAAVGDPANTAIVTCATNDADEATVTYNVSSAAIAAPVGNPSPNIIPAGSFWSNLMIVGFIAGVGVLVLTLRRNG